MGFAEGFQGGFGMVDAALTNKRREELAAEQEKRQAAQFDKTIGLQNATLEATKEYQKGNLDRYDKQIKSEDQRHKDTINIQQQQVDRQSAHDKDMLAVQREQNAISRMNAASNAAANNAQTNLANWKLSQAKIEQNREEARQRFNNSIIVDPKTGQQTLNVIPGQEQQWINDAKTIGLPMDNIGNGLGQYQNDINILKGALAHDDRDGVRGQHGPAVLGAVNRIYSNAINTGIGPYDGHDEQFKGLNVIKKEVVDIVPSRDKAGKPIKDDHHFVVREYYGDKDGKPVIGKDGRPLFSEGPATEGRDNDPHAPVKQLSAEQLIGSVNAHQQLLNTLKAHPQEYALIQNVMRQASAQQAKDEKGNYEAVKMSGAVDEKGNQQPDSLEIYNKKTGLTKDQERLLSNPIQTAKPEQTPASQPPRQESPAQSPGLEQAKAIVSGGAERQQLADQIQQITGQEVPGNIPVEQLRAWLDNNAGSHAGGKSAPDETPFVQRGLSAVANGVKNKGAEWGNLYRQSSAGR